MRASVLLSWIIFFAISTLAHSAENSSSVLRIGKVGELQTLDPAKVSADLKIISHALYETLYQYSYLESPYRITPSIAADEPKFSKDGLKATIRLRTDIRFHGLDRFLTAQDVVNSIKRVADPQTESPGWWLLEWKIEGLDDFRKALQNKDLKAEARSTLLNQTVSGLVAKDLQTLELKLTRPYPQLKHALSSIYLAPVAIEKIEAETGPFFVSKKAGTSGITLEQNPHSHADFYPSRGSASQKKAGLLIDTKKPLPLLSKIEIEFRADHNTLWSDFLKRRFDFIGEIALPPGSVLREIKEVDAHLISEKDAAFYSILLNTQDPLLKNVNLRRAFSFMLDRGKWVEEFNLEGGAALNSVIPKSLLNPSSKKNSITRFDLSKARQLLKKAGFPEGKGLPVLKLEIGSDDRVSHRLGEFLKAQFSQIGVQIEPAYRIFPEYIELLQSRKFQLAVWGWSLDYPDLRSVFRPFYSKNLSPKGPNASGFQNTAFDALYEQMVKLPDGAKRNAIALKMDQILQSEAPLILGYSSSALYLVSSRVGNFVPRNLISNQLKYLTIRSHSR